MSGKSLRHSPRLSPEVVVLTGFTITILLLLVVGAAAVSVMYSQTSQEVLIVDVTYTRRVATPLLPVTSVPSGTPMPDAQLPADPAPALTVEPSASPASTNTPTDAAITASALATEPSATPASAEPTPTATIIPTTPTPISTEAPSHTPLTPSPTATQVTTTQGWDAAGLRSATDLNGWLLYGELINNTGTARQVISIGGMFYDAGGALLADSLDAFSRTPTNLVPADGRLPFELSLVGVENVAAYTLSVNAQVHPANPRQDFLFTNIAQIYARDRLCTTADFRNPGADLTLSLEIAVVLFDDVDRVINVSDAETPDLADVAGGQTLNVQVCIDPPNQNVSRLDWRAWGR